MNEKRMLLASGDKLGPYEIIELIGAGGMGQVYKARDTRLDRLVAVKVSTEPFSERFEREAHVVAALNHPNICTLFDVGPNYLVMEYIEGQPFKPPLPVERAVKHAAQVAEALEAAHAKGIVHRDIKPSNILITARGEAKVLDFGLARRVDTATSGDSEALTEQMLTEPGGAIGTTAYMSPEQVRGQLVDGRTDLWALGVVLYQAITGVRPFEGATPGMILESVLTEAPVPARERNPQIPAALERVISRCLEKDRRLRYQQACEVLADLRNLGRASATLRVATSYRKMVASVVLVLALTLTGYFYLHRGSKLSDKDTIVLADFTNRTGEQVFDGTLRQGLAVQLEQSPFLSVISEERIQQTLGLMGQPAGARLTPAIAREICQRTSSTALIDGSIANVGNQYVTDLRAVNCRTGDSMAEVQAIADGRERVLKALGTAASELRGKLGESLSSVQKFDTPVEQATTPSLDALQAYSVGMRDWWGRADPAAAEPFFRRAVELDHDFAMAYALLGLIAVYMGQTDVAAQNARKAYELRDRASQRERFLIEGTYYFLATGDLEKARREYELWAQTYPREILPPGTLASSYTALGEYDKALEKSRGALRSGRASSADYAVLVGCFLLLNRVEEARAVARQAQAKGLDSAWLHFNLYLLAFLENDAAGMARQVEWAAGKPGIEDALLIWEADTAAYSGQLGKARELSGRAIASAERIDGKETVARYQADGALREALFGNAAQARGLAKAALELSTDRDAQYGAALALSLSRGAEQGRIEKLADDLARRFPEDTWVRFSYLPTLRAQLALSRNNAASAIEALRAATPYELASNGGGPLSTSLYQIYVRGQAYLAARQGDKAAAEFQKILDHPGVVFNEPIGALARFELGRALALAGDTTKAKDAYRNFLTLWKDADLDIPILKQAKAEYSKLQ